MKNIVIVGAGPGLGMSIAKKFGKNGFRVALIARDEEKLNQLVIELEQLGIEAASFQADILNKDQISLAFTTIKEKYGFIDVVEYSPTPSIDTVTNALDVTEENALYQFQFNVLGAISSIREVLPDMLDKQSGALLFTTGGAAVNPVPMMGNVGIAVSGLRNYIFNLNSELKDKGIYAGHISIGIWMQPNSGVQDKIADIWYDMYTKRDRVEEFITEDKV
ncbi:SDR family NAD(P)-dependent oxidoreductase [Priestia megaterium]|jgi:short-subunit dehydrogenase|uniref:SDR family NAD(P)-dependent oxidoreductase n=1 Tax=Priestia megaterium TaxID=1404 RepID=UPI00209FFAA1|nr:SDR family oxidoreductase [Priestia megaterium]MCP1446981.1 short-subunit dehydrogenase [Priestia megaterium]MDC7769713.1 SDR family NAD(P)-dependent oxidoreductase [Priestia megaterium]MED4050540.1 SDR family NAD(P)-dependent oxidoreductase [Priestia megaterium]MED4062689.1 SDR family NAD(P)-dependent oxidoreductase [Priestia megaterium]WJD78671.1 SDR family oxidoreductase [Priestia megaterium]